MSFRIFLLILSLLAISPALAADEEPLDEKPVKSVDKSKLSKVAVTDITYKKELSRKIRYVIASEKEDIKAKGKISESESAGYNHYTHSRSQTLGDSKMERSAEVVAGEHDIAYIQVGELRSLTGDVKAEMLKSGVFRLSQAKPYTSRTSEDIYDVIKRIKSGYYPGADYVLFGSLIDIQGSNDIANIQGSDATTVGVRIELAAEFNLINTKTYEVVSAFSASGEGSDVRIIKPGSSFTPSRVRAFKDVSKSLAEDAITQMLDQLPDGLQNKSKSQKRN